MELMKNGLAGPAIKRIASAFSQLDKNFNAQSFQEQALANIDNLQLKQRVEHIIYVMNVHLPSNYQQALPLFLQIKTVWDYGDKNDPLSSFTAWPVIDYIAEYGLEDPHESLKALKYLTSLFSAEFAIRRFIQKYPDICHHYFLKWITDKDEHVRRLVTEGTRPRLPWGIRLKAYDDNPSVNIPLLNHLALDESLYVRRSVANHINDISKKHPNLVIELCNKWFDPQSPNMRWLITHATRTLVKSGHKDVFPLLGYSAEPKLECSDIGLSKNKVIMGDDITFTFQIASLGKCEQIFVVDFALYFVKANDKQKAKVFKIKNITLQENESIMVEKSFSFKAISTRKYYAGKHTIEILINGKSQSTVNFSLLNNV